MTSLVIYVLPIVLFTFNQLSSSTAIKNEDLKPYKNSKILRIEPSTLSSASRAANGFLKNTEFYNSEHSSGLNSRAKSESRLNGENSEDLFLDNEQDEDQIGGDVRSINEKPDILYQMIRPSNQHPAIRATQTEKCDLEHEFKCWNGSCINRKLVCDQRFDCAEGEDELNCTVHCNPTFEVQCKQENKCVNLNQLCDGIVDCIVDASDEQNCECGANEFQCRDKTCIKSSLRCNNVFDCREGSDELDCAYNEIVQCANSNDKNCSIQSKCKPNEFECVSTRKCIESALKCDGYVNCADFSDELNCFNDKEKCKANEFRCRTSGRCISVIFLCDRKVDCDSDQSDEDFCWRCRDEEFTCNNGQCILRELVCNKKIDCFDGTDESNCTYTGLVKSELMRQSNGSTLNEKINRQSVENNLRSELHANLFSPTHKLKKMLRQSKVRSINLIADRELSVRERGTAILECDGALLPVSWFKMDANNLIKLRRSSNVAIRGGRLVVKSVSISDGGVYVCRTSRTSIRTLLSVQEISSLDELMLNDQDLQGNASASEDEFQAKESSLCNYNEFACGNSNQCVLRLNHCDSFQDCIDGSDEIGCSPPMIVQSPDRQVIASEGDNVTLTCKAIGTPTPVITWKMNWESIRTTNPHLITSSNNGYGTLKIKNVQQEDTARYICQARNNLDTTSAPFDSELIIKSKNGVCLPPYFNDDAKQVGQCLRCFCFNLTSTCFSSSNLKVQTIPLLNRLSYAQLAFDTQRNAYRELPVHPMNQEKIIYNQGNSQFILNSSIGDIGESVVYWSLPHPFTGNLIRSYGSFFKYVFNYAIPSNRNRLEEVDVIIRNDQNNMVAYHSFGSEQATSPNSDNQVQLRLSEHQFTKERFSKSFTFDRPEFLTLLRNVTHFYLRAKFDRQFVESKILGIELDVAVEKLKGNDHVDTHQNTHIDTAKLVEKCSCPLGYSGSSCESCQTGYVRSSEFHYGPGSCVRETPSCMCNGNSNTCDQFLRCYNCQNNSEGKSCQNCKRGFYGNPEKGIPCKKCNCPDLDISSSSELTGACVLDENGVTATCVSCPLGTTGRSCENCVETHYRDSNGKCRLKESANRSAFQQQQRNMENNVTCGANQFKCKESTGCIQISAYCDGFADCPLGSDETNCPNSVCNEKGSYDPFYNRRTRKCDCKPNTTGERCERCRSNSFNFGGKNGCTKCNCMGVSNRCEGKNANRETITLNPELSSLNLTTIDDILVTEDDGNMRMVEFDNENSISFLLYTQNPIKKKPTTILYWKLPRTFLGNKLNAYGGKLSYKIVFEHLRPDEQLSYSPDLVLVGGNQEEMHYSHPQSLKSKTLHKLTVELVEDSFTDAKGGPIRKEQLMNVLFDLNRILIKASYTKDIVFTGIKEIELMTADVIESCQCPKGYGGDSCQKCTEGHFKKPGSYHQCIPCDCNGNSKKCDPMTGQCLECEYNFTGERCDRCKNGFLLSRTRGFTECVPFENQEEGHQENRICNNSVEGYRCNRCRYGYYNLVNGECTKCTCSGVTDKCREKFAFLDEITAKSETLQLIDKEMSRLYTVSLSGDQKYTFTNIPRDRIVHWQLPVEFLGDKVNSYGYNLSYQLDIDPGENEETTFIMNPDVEISGRTTTIVYMTGDTKADRVFNVPLKEDMWEKLDNTNRQMSKISKLEFLNVLSDVHEISIRAVYHDKQQTTTISNIRLTTVVDNDPTGRQDRIEKSITHIEECLCGAGYEGSSCEQCATGYTKNQDGLCVKCNCNGHSQECRFVNNGTDSYMECLNCLHNTEGRQCDKCVAQYYGDPTLRTSTSCKPCPCPSTRPSGNFASTCRQNFESGEIVCNCQEGYQGNHCEECSPAFESDNRYPGRCRLSTFYRNRTLSNPQQLPKLTEASQTIVTSANARLRIDPNHLSQVIQAGETGLLRCVSQSLTSGGKLLPVVWIREGANLPQQNRQTQGILEIFNARPEDSGIYYCLSNDSDGTVLKLRANLVVREDESRPRESTVDNRINNRSDNRLDNRVYNRTQQQQLSVRIEPRVLNVRTGEQVLIRCIAQGREPIAINWLKSTPAIDELVQETRIINNALVIDSATYSDSGDYYCEAKNSEASNRARSRLIVSQTAEEQSSRNQYANENQNSANRPSTADSINVIIPPSVHIIPERQTIIQGKSGQLHCVAEGNPAPKITWTKARSELDTSRHLITNTNNRSTLEIRDSIVSDRGLYVCRAENTGGMTQQSSIVEIERREVPAIKIFPSAVQMLPEHSSALFQCRLTAGIPTPTIEWKKADNSELDDNSNIEQLPGGVIRFTNLSPAVQGKYICIAYNQAGRVTAEALLHVQGSINVRIKQTGPYRVRVGDRVKLECDLYGQATNAVPEYRIEWRKMVSNNSQIQIPYVTHEDLDNKASLSLNSVNLDDSGYYVCLGIGLQNNQVVVQERIQLIVEPLEDSFETTLQVEDRVVRANLDEPIEIRCFVRKTKDKIKINWFKRGSNLPANSRVEDGTLYIDRVSLEDDGVYVCTGKNELTKTTEFTQDVRLAVVGFFGSVSPKIVITPAMQSVKVGDQVRVRCEVEDDRARIHWTKLKPDHTKQTIKFAGNQDAILSVRNHFDQDQRMSQFGDTLVISNISVEDQAFSSGGTSEATAEILVTGSDNMSGERSSSNEALRRQEVQAGKSLVLKCPMRSGHHNVEWSFDQRQELPDNVNPNQYTLTINNIRKSNEGRYICQAYDERGSIRDRDYVYLTVQDLNQECAADEFNCGDGTCLSNRVKCDSKYDCQSMLDESECDSISSEDEVELGGTLVLDCVTANQSSIRSNSKVKWFRMNGNQPTEQFSDNVSIDNNSLTIRGIRAENGGVYRCMIDGTFKDNIVTIKVSKFSAPYRTSIQMHCKSNVIQNVQNYHWKRNDSPLPDNALVKNNLLTIRNVNEESAGIYTCIARNQTHRVKIPSILRVTHIIPLFTGQSFIGVKHYSSLNSNEIDISFKIRNLTANTLILFSGSAKKQDFLAFMICNQHLEVKLEVGNGVVTLKSHSKLKVNVWHRVKFKRHNLRALLEVDDQPEVEHIQLNKEKSVGLNLNDDYWYIGGYTNYTHLNVNRKLSITSGLYGCVSQLKIDGKKYTLMRSTYSHNVQNCDTCDVREQKLDMFEKLIENQKHLFVRNTEYSNGHHINQHINQLNRQLFNISTMMDLPNGLCKNGGICQEALNHQGTKCICKNAFSGLHCEKFLSEVCLPDQCGPGGRCIDLKKTTSTHEHSMSINKFIKKQQNQFICDCAFGRDGDRCQKNITIEQPRFTGERSFITYRIPRESSSHISILIKLKLTLYQPNNEIRDGLIIYSAEKSNGMGDFISLSIKNQRFEFQFNTGSGVTIVQSDALASFNSSWYTVRLVRNGVEGRLIISDRKEYVVHSLGPTKGINLRLPLYLGNVDEQLVKLPPSLNESIGFIGCVNRLEINNQTIDLLNHLIDSSNIKNCKVQSICSRNPCKNDAICTELSTDSYRCTCRPPFSGTHCEKNNGICATSKPCHNRGKCLDLSSLHFDDQNSYKCCCAMGFSGRSCDIVEQYSNRKWANFDNSKTISYLSIDNLLSLNNTKTDQIIEFTFKTERFNGLMFYQGELDLSQKDYLMMNLNDGYLEVEWQLGSGVGLIRSEEALNDGRKHQVIFKRKGQEGQLIVDISNPIFDKSTGSHTQLNVENNAIHIGGHKEIEKLNKIRPSISGFEGCIGSLRLNDANEFLDLSLITKNSCNVRPCDF